MKHVRFDALTDWIGNYFLLGGSHLVQTGDILLKGDVINLEIDHTRIIGLSSVEKEMVDKIPYFKSQQLQTKL